jgi:hypothetical protein
MKTESVISVDPSKYFLPNISPINKRKHVSSRQNAIIIIKDECDDTYLEELDQ